MAYNYCVWCINKFPMQVRTIIIILLALALALSITALIYNIALQRTYPNYHHFAPATSPYLTSKYQAFESLIYAVLFGWQIAVILAEILSLCGLLCMGASSRCVESVENRAYWLRACYVLGSAGVMGQTVLFGYPIAAIVEAGYENGVTVEDLAIVVLQGVSLGLQLTALAIMAYTFPPMQKNAEPTEKQSSSPVEIEPASGVGRGLPQNVHDDSGKKLSPAFPVASPTINLFKPNLNQHTSPMGQHFSNLPQMVEAVPQNMIKEPLLQQPSSFVRNDHTIPISSSKSSGRLKVQVPRLKLDEMRRKEGEKREYEKKQNEKKDPVFMLDNLDISAIGPLKLSKVHSEISNSSDQSPHPTAKKKALSPNRL